MDLKKLEKDFSDSWKNIKSLLDVQADEMKTQGDVLAELIEAKEEHDQILKELIDKL